MSTLAQIAGVLGFILSVLNLVHSLYSRRTALTLQNVVFAYDHVYDNDGNAILAATLVNRSGLPVSIYGFALGVSSRADLASADPHQRWNTPGEGFQTSRLPVVLAPYEARYIALPIFPHSICDEVARLAVAPAPPPAESAEGEDQPYSYLVAYTSRRKQRLRFHPDITPLDVWLHNAPTVE